MSQVKKVKESDKEELELVNDGSGVKDGEKEVEIDGDKGEKRKEEVEEEVEEVEEEVEKEVEEEVEERGEGLEKLEGEEDKHEKEVVPDSEGVEENGDKDIDVGNAVSNSNDLGLSEEVPVLKACNSIQSGVSGPNVEKEPIKDVKEALNPRMEDGDDVIMDAHDPPNKHQGVDGEVGAPNKGSCELNEKFIKEEELKNEASNKEDAMDAECRVSHTTCIFDADSSGGGESGTEDEQAAFIFELDKFHKERYLEFKPPKFYGEPLNLLKLWRSVMKLGGYDKVTACKYWRQVGESFKPPKTCTTVSWTFRIFYEKALLEYEKHRTSGDGTYIPAGLPMSTSVENQASGSGRARRDAAARAMQGWHSQRILDNGEVSDPIIKDKNSTSFNKREKQLKNLNQSILKQRKRPLSMEATADDVRAKMPKSQSETTVIDIGSPADWVKINVRVTKDCYEVYALVPGLLREEVRVQSDPAGRLVISGEPENPDNPWNVTPFKKVVILPTRIDPHQTSAVVTLHGQLFVRVPFEQYD